MHNRDIYWEFNGSDLNRTINDARYAPFHAWHFSEDEPFLIRPGTGNNPVRAQTLTSRPDKAPDAPSSRYF